VSVKAYVGLPRSRSWAGLATGVVGLALMTVVLVAAREQLGLAEVALLFLVPVVAAAAVGGVWSGLPAAIVADLLVNFFFVPPYHTLLVESREHVLVLMVYVLVAGSVSLAVDLAARQRARAARRDTEVRLLGNASAAPVAANSLTKLLGEIGEAFGMTTVALLESQPTGEQPVASFGPTVGSRPTLSAPAGEGLRLVAWGPDVFAEDQHVLQRMAAAAARTLEAQRLTAQAAQANDLAEMDRVRSALLAAVGHDLRTPLAGIKAAVSSLRHPDLRLSGHAQSELLATLEESTDQLANLIDNLLSLSRLQAGALSVRPDAVALDAVVAQAMLAAGSGWDRVQVDVPDGLPLAWADSGLLERVIANVLSNAVAASPPDLPIEVTGTATHHHVALAVVDHGAGVPAEERTRIFEPFQRLHDRSTAGLGLGLAIARGFTEAMGGSIKATETLGGGLTMTITLPAAEGRVAEHAGTMSADPL
jgi:K+-sensing histidine kinase KdpD